MASSKRAQLLDLAATRARQPAKPRLVDTGPACAWVGCGKPLIKVRPHQRFCHPRCRYQAWLASRGRR
jgi:hypothetical protein